MSGVLQLLPPLIAFAIAYATISWIGGRLSEELKAAIEKWLARILFFGFTGGMAYLAVRSFWSVSSALFAMMVGSLYFLWSFVRLIKSKWRPELRRSAPGHFLYSLLLIAVAGIGESNFLAAHEARFEPLFAALDQYKREHGNYPGELDYLVPQYVSALPQCPMELSSSPGVVYHPSNEDFSVSCFVGVSLIFPYRGWYRSETRDWLYFD